MVTLAMMPSALTGSRHIALDVIANDEVQNWLFFKQLNKIL